SNCKLFLAKVNTYTWIDYEGKEVTNSYVSWMDSTDYAANEYGGTITSKFIPCSSYWTPDKDMCPPGTANDDRTGTVQGVFGTDANGAEQRVRLVCVRAGQSWPEYQQNALANNKADALTAASEAEGCTTITAAPFAGKRELYRTESRNVIS